MWLVILITCISASCTNVGKALQKKGTQKLPRLVLDRGVLKQYLQDSTWTTGLAADIGGGLMMIFVVTRAPISVIQPISSSGLAVLAVFSHFYLHEHMSPFEWAAVALSGLGIVIMGITAAEQPAMATEASVPEGLRTRFRTHAGTLLLLSGLGALSGYLWWTRRRRQQGARGAHPAHLGAAPHALGRLEEVAAGAQAGCLYSLSATSCRIGFLLRGKHVAYAPMGIGLSVALTGLGLVCQTKGLKDGSAMVVCTVAAVASAVTGLLAGVMVLGERLPDPGPRLWWYLLSWVCVLGGVTGLSGGMKGPKAPGAAGRGGLHGSGGSGVSLSLAGRGAAEWSGVLHHLPSRASVLMGSGKGTILPV